MTKTFTNSSILVALATEVNQKALNQICEKSITDWKGAKEDFKKLIASIDTITESNKKNAISRISRINCQSGLWSTVATYLTGLKAEVEIK